MTHIEFTVKGRGKFPFDMLRFDRCYPISWEDAIHLERGTDDKPYREVRLASERRPTDNMAPCVARWEASGWEIKEVHRDAD